MTAWITAGASSIGKSHIDSNLPNQDSLFFQQNERFSVAVVCDGAGSATMSEQGSRYFAQAVGEFLIKTAQQTDEKTTFDKSWLSQVVIVHKLSEIRQALAQQIPAEFSLKDYHSTVTAVLILPTLDQALLIQIGDSPLITSQFIVNTNHVPKQIDYFHAMQFYGEDGKDEYVNETHFITQDNWQSQLRVQWLDLQTVDMLALMTDGCGDLVIEGGKIPKTIYRPFFGNLLFNLLQTQTADMANQLIQTTLDNPATYRLTGDDKTLIVLYREKNKQYQSLEPIIEVAEHATLPNAPKIPFSTTPQSVWQSADNMAISRVKNSTQNQALSYSDLTENLADNLQQIPPQSALPPIQKNPLTSVDATALPQPVALPSKKNKTALIASIVAVAGMAGLIGLNKDRIFNQFSPKSDVSNTQASSTPANAPNTALSTTAVTQTALPEFSLTAPLKINNLAVTQNDGTVMSLILGFKNGVSQFPVAKSVLIEKLTEGNLMAKLVCTPIAPNLINSLSSESITPNPAWQYAQCILTLEAVNAKNQKIAMSNELNEIVLPQGLLPFFAKITTPSSSVVQNDFSDIAVYYLPEKR